MSRPHPDHPRRGPGCPAPAVLEALSAGEAVDEATSKHVAGCADCGAYVAALKAEQDAFLKMRPPEQFLSKLQRRDAGARAERSTWWRLLPAVALAGLALVVVLPRVLPQDNGVLTKGSPFRVVVRSGGGDAVPVQEDARLRPNDALRFSYDAPADGYLLVLDLDGTGNASVFHEGAVKKGDASFLPGSIVLDAAPGPEWLFAVFSERKVDAAPLLARLKEQAGAAAPKLACDGCRISTLRFQKQLP